MGQKGSIEEFWNGAHLEYEEREDLEIRECRRLQQKWAGELATWNGLAEKGGERKLIYFRHRKIWKPKKSVYICSLSGGCKDGLSISFLWVYRGDSVQTMTPGVLISTLTNKRDLSVRRAQETISKLLLTRPRSYSKQSAPTQVLPDDSHQTQLAS